MVIQENIVEVGRLPKPFVIQPQMPAEATELPRPFRGPRTSNAAKEQDRIIL